MKPTTEKMTKPANIEVDEFTVQTISASLGKTKKKQAHIKIISHLLMFHSKNEMMKIKSFFDGVEGEILMKVR